MIPNITSGNSFNGLVMYNEKKVRNGVAERISSHVIPLKSTSKQIVGFLEDVASQKPNIEDKTFHVSLALAAGDKVSSEQLVNIADDYMKNMGYSDTPYMVYRHFDTDVQHVHIVGTRVTIEGKKVSDSYERYHSQRVARKIEIDYGLTIVPSKKGEYMPPVSVGNILNKDGVQHIKNVISGAIYNALSVKKVTSLDAFIAELKQKNVVVQLVKKDSNGDNLVTPGIMFALGKRLTPETKRIKGSSFYQGYTYEKLINKFNVNQIIEETKPKVSRSRDEVKVLAKVILKELTHPQYKTVDDLTMLFAKHKLEPIYFKNSGGIYGLKIKDLISSVEYKASEIDRAFSWNSILKLLDGTESELKSVKTKAPSEIPFNVTVSPEPGDAKIIWVKSIADKTKVVLPLKDLMARLSRRGFVSQNELINGLKEIGYKPHFTRDYSKGQGGIVGIAYTEISSGKTYSGASLDFKELSWNAVSKYVANDLKASNYASYVESVLDTWLSVNRAQKQDRVDDLIVYLNQNGLTISRKNDLNFISQVGGTDKVLMTEITSQSKFSDLFRFRNSQISGDILSKINTKGYAVEPLSSLNRQFLKALYLNDRDSILKLVNDGNRIDLSKFKFLDIINQATQTYRSITSLSKQISNTLKYMLYLKGVTGVDKVNLRDFELALNKRGVLMNVITDPKESTPRISFISRDKSISLDQAELAKSVNIEKIRSIIDFDSLTSSIQRNVLPSYTDRQIEIFKATEDRNEFSQRVLISQGAVIDLNDFEASYFNIDEDVLLDEFEGSTPQTKSFAMSFIEGLAEVAQGECPVSRDESKSRKKTKKKNPNRRR